VPSGLEVERAGTPVLGPWWPLVAELGAPFIVIAIGVAFCAPLPRSRSANSVAT